MIEKLSDYIKIIDKSKYKYTRQKESVLKALINADRHMNVKEIYKLVKSEEIGIASLYRILKVFKELDIVKEVFLNNTSFYELKIYSGKPLHIHFQDYDSEEIVDIDDMDLVIEFVKIINKIEKRKNIDIKDSNIMLTGRSNYE